MRANVFLCAFIGCLFGLLLESMGYPFDTKEFWAALALLLAYGVAYSMK